jgi:hypothetical protein
MLSIDIVAGRRKLFQKNMPGERIQDTGVRSQKYKMLNWFNRLHWLN